MDVGTINTIASWLGVHPLLIAILLLWTLVWKGLGLWRAANLRQKYWFIAILVINTLGILEIIYLFLVARKYQVEVIDESK